MFVLSSLWKSTLKFWVYAQLKQSKIEFYCKLTIKRTISSSQVIDDIYLYVFNSRIRLRTMRFVTTRGVASKKKENFERTFLRNYNPSGLFFKISPVYFQSALTSTRKFYASKKSNAPT